MKKTTLLSLLLAAGMQLFAQAPPKPYGVLPNKAQLNWHQMEMYCIIHFGADTYTDKEWGFGDEDPAIVNPTKFDAMQIVGAAKAGGFKGVVIVAKHHDGLCLWPTKTTTHNITKTPWRNGKGDMVREYQQACKKLGMQLGLYCSPWDRNSADYGTPAYVDIYRKQVRELYTNYGPIFTSWHDGANGGDGYYGGKRGVRKIDRSTYYGWPTTWAMIRKLQPTAAIFGDVGPDVRWVGNEEGLAGETCWATYTPKAPEAGKQPSNGFVIAWQGTEGTLNGKYWIPAECDVPFRPGWFYHASQDDQVKTPYQLLDLYYKSVGRGANLDLGLAPNREGLLSWQDVASLKSFGLILKQTFAVNLAKGAKLSANNIRGGNAVKYGPAFLLDADRYTYWATNDNIVQATLTVNLATVKTFNVIRLRENIKLGQRITSFKLEALQSGEWKTIANGTSIGANRLVRLPQNITATQLRLSVKGQASIALSDFGLYKEPPHLVPPLISRDSLAKVHLSTTAPVSSIHYTTDGSEPTLQSRLYTQPFVLAGGGVVKACGFESNKQKSEVAIRLFGISKAGWRVLSTIPQSNRKVANAIDDNEETIWHTISNDPTAKVQFPQDVVVDMGKTETISAFTYLPRQDKKAEGIAYKYIFYTSTDGNTWTEATAGELSNIQANPTQQVIKPVAPIKARYFKFSVLQVVSGSGIAVAELGILTN